MRKFVERSLRPLILIGLGAWLLRLSWLKWTNIILDYGRELYTPWQIACGQVLYKDIAFLFGPFPSYWNALLFKIFGVSIMTLVIFNILLVMGITLLIYRFFSYTTDKRVAFYASAAFLSILAFNQSIYDQGNFAYICPYSYSVTYAVFFALLAIDRFTAFGRSGKDAWLVAVGALIGLTALCRFEIFTCLTIAIAVGFISKGVFGQWPLKRFLKLGTLALGGFLIPVGIASLYFSTQLPFSRVLPSILGFNNHWFEVFNNNYYLSMAGLDSPGHNFIIMLITAACYALVVVTFKYLCMGAECLEKNNEQWKGTIFILLGLVVIVQIGLWILSDHYNEIFKGLPVVIILMVGGIFLFLGNYQHDEGKQKRLLPLLVMAVWGLLMLTKVFFKVQINSEGFVYAMPAVMLFIAVLVGFVPQYFERIYHTRGSFLQRLASVLTVVILIAGVRSTADAYQSRQFPIRAGSDTIICNWSVDPEIGEIAAFLKDQDKIMDKGANFVVFPEGVMLNFLTKRRDPLKHITFMSAELISFGEEEMLRSLQEHRPDYVVLSNQYIHAYYYDGPGAVYPRAIRKWILANYHPVWPAYPEADNVIMVLKRT